MSEKRILITGISGFTGKHIAEKLSRGGWKIYGIDNYIINEDPNYAKVDLQDTAKLREVIRDVNPHAVMHLAAVAYIGHGKVNDFYITNLIGTRNLLQCLAEMAPNIESVLIASSANVYGANSTTKTSEQVVPMPVNDYAVSKLGMEYMAMLWVEKLPLFIVRPFNYTGPGQAKDFIIPKIVECVKQGAESIDLGNIEVFREFNDVRFIAEVYAKLLENIPIGKIINVCTGKTYSVKEVLSLVEKLTGRRLEVRVNEKFVRPNEIRELSGDDAYLRSIIDNIPKYELKDTINWMLHA